MQKIEKGGSADLTPRPPLRLERGGRTPLPEFGEGQGVGFIKNRLSLRFSAPLRLNLFLCFSLIGLVFLFSTGAASQAKELFLWDEMFIYRTPEEIFARTNPEDITLMATGDVMLARTVNVRMVESGDFTFPFANTADFLARADITWVNLETPLISDCPLKYVSKVFCSDPRAVEGLVSAGVDIAGLANNHGEDYGLPGLEETEQVLTSAGIATTGLSEPVIIERKGRTIGFLSFNNASLTRRISSAHPNVVRAQIAHARPLVDTLIVSFHWGVEYTLQQTPRQRNLAKLAIDLGADMVIGHHPHWLQGVEVYKGKRILYSLGNFIFDQEDQGWVTYGAVALVNIRPDGQMQLHFVPVVIEDQSTPRLPSPEEGDMILARIASVSLNLDNAMNRR